MSSEITVNEIEEKKMGLNVKLNVDDITSTRSWCSVLRITVIGH